MYKQFYIFLLFIIYVKAKLTVFVTDGPTERIGPRLYKKELLTDKFQDPKELAYDSSSRNLFFMYMDDDIQNSGRAMVNVLTKETKKIKGIERNKATAVDSDTSNVYFGSDNGLYKYDPLKNEAVNIGLYNMNIHKLVIRNNEMYLLDANNHMMYKAYNDGKVAVKVGGMKSVMQFEIDNQKNVHYVSLCGVFCAIGGHDIIKNKDLSIVYHFLIDEDKTYGVTYDAIYEIQCNNGTATKIAGLDFFARSMIFGDYGDIFYSINSEIYRLRPITSYFIYNVHKNTRGEVNVNDILTSSKT